MFNLDDFDKIFYSYESIDEEVSLLEKFLLNEAHAATKNVHKQVDILRQTNKEQLSLSKNDEEENIELAKKFNETMGEM